MHRLMLTVGDVPAIDAGRAPRPLAKDPDNQLVVADEPAAAGRRGGPRRAAGGQRPAEPEGGRPGRRPAGRRRSGRRGARPVAGHAGRDASTSAAASTSSPGATCGYPFLEAFDLPDSNLSCPKRERSTTAPQALALLNAAEATAAAKALAERLEREARRRDGADRAGVPAGARPGADGGGAGAGRGVPARVAAERAVPGAVQRERVRVPGLRRPSADSRLACDADRRTRSCETPASRTRLDRRSLPPQRRRAGSARSRSRRCSPRRADSPPSSRRPARAEEAALRRRRRSASSSCSCPAGRRHVDTFDPKPELHAAARPEAAGVVRPGQDAPRRGQEQAARLEAHVQEARPVRHRGLRLVPAHRRAASTTSACCAAATATASRTPSRST